MTTLNQKLTEAISNLIPEAGLKKGEYACTNKDCDYYGERGFATHHSRCTPSWWCDYCDTPVRGKTGFFDEPELRHVLWVLERAQPKASIEMHVYGGRMCFTIKEADGHISPRWIELDKTLYQQTDECKMWLLDLLIKN